jgi:hypothetical protein
MEQRSHFKVCFQDDKGTKETAKEITLQFLDSNLIFHDTLERVLNFDNKVEYHNYRLYVINSNYSTKKKVMTFGECEEEGKCYLGEFPVLSEVENQNRLNQIIAISTYLDEEYITPFVNRGLEPLDFKTQFVFKGERNYIQMKEAWEEMVIPDMLSFLIEEEGSESFDKLTCYENLIEIIQRDRSVDASAMEPLENILRGINILKSKCLELEYQR